MIRETVASDSEDDNQSSDDDIGEYAGDGDQPSDEFIQLKEIEKATEQLVTAQTNLSNAIAQKKAHAKTIELYLDPLTRDSVTELEKKLIAKIFLTVTDAKAAVNDAQDRLIMIQGKPLTIQQEINIIKKQKETLVQKIAHTPMDSETRIQAMHELAQLSAIHVKKEELLTSRSKLRLKNRTSSNTNCSSLFKPQSTPDKDLFEDSASFTHRLALESEKLTRLQEQLDERSERTRLNS